MARCFAALLLATHTVAMIYVQQLTPSDAAPFNSFGGEVSISGDYALVGAYGNRNAGSQTGSAYVFARSGSTWTQQAKLVASDAARDDFFGLAASISGDYALVGATGSRSAYVFARSGSTWTQQAKLVASDTAEGGGFGNEVSISGDYALVGATGSRAAYVFARSGSTWTQQAKLVAGDAAQYNSFGSAVSISGDYVLVGASSFGSGSPGSAYVFARSGSTWTQQAKLVASDAASSDVFGGEVSISGDYVLVGAKGNNDAGTWSGSAYVFARSGSTWTQQAKLVASDAAQYDYFGSAVSISGDNALVGAHGNDDAGTQSGSAYVFARSGSTWTQHAKLVASDAAQDDHFGSYVSISGDNALVGATYNDVAGTHSGSAYMYNLTDAPTVSTGSWRYVNFQFNAYF